MYSDLGSWLNPHTENHPPRSAQGSLTSASGRHIRECRYYWAEAEGLEFALTMVRLTLTGGNLGAPITKVSRNRATVSHHLAQELLCKRVYTQGMDRLTFRLHVTGTATKATSLRMLRNDYLNPSLSIRL